MRLVLLLHRRSLVTPPAARALLLAGLAATLLACARDDVRSTDPGSRTSDSASGAPLAAATGTATSSAPVDTAELPAGTWTVRLAENKLRSAGLAAVRQGHEVRRAGLGVPGTRYMVSGAPLEIYLYADVMARGRDTDALDLARAAPEVSPPPLLVTDGNLAALLFTGDPGVRARVRNALRTEPDDGALRPAAGNPDRPGAATP